MAIGRINATLTGVQPGGLAKIVPTSVAVGSGSGSINGNGTVSFSGCSSVSLNNCFNSNYTNYRIVCDMDVSTALDFYFRLRVNGTDNSTTSSYVTQGLNADGTTVAGFRTTANYGRLGPGNTDTTIGWSAEFYRPFVADSTAFICHYMPATNAGYVSNFSGSHNQNTSYDGLTIYPSTGTVSGSISVYGYTI